MIWAFWFYVSVIAIAAAAWAFSAIKERAFRDRRKMPEPAAETVDKGMRQFKLIIGGKQ